MSYVKTEWLDHLTPHPDRYIATDNGDGTFTLLPDFGTPVQVGTPLSAANMNKIEQGIYDAQTGEAQLGAELSDYKRKQRMGAV